MYSTDTWWGHGVVTASGLGGEDFMVLSSLPHCSDRHFFLTQAAWIKSTVHGKKIGRKKRERVRETELNKNRSFRLFLFIIFLFFFFCLSLYFPVQPLFIHSPPRYLSAELLQNRIWRQFNKVGTLWSIIIIIIIIPTKKKTLKIFLEHRSTGSI